MVALRDSSQMFAKFLFPTTFVGDNVATFSVGRTVIDGKASSCSHSANFEFGFFYRKKMRCAVLVLDSCVLFFGHPPNLLCLVNTVV